jgi:hypothetical protein
MVLMEEYRMETARIWFVFKDVHGQYSVSKQPTGGTMVAGPFTWNEAKEWMHQHGVPNW